jgi:ABC-2 type transport system ATP-binding protein
MAVTTTGHLEVPAPTGEGQPVLEARGLTKVFGTGPQAVHAVDGLDLTVRAGEVVALLGPNGAGKTTTIKMSAGLVTPTAGRLRIAGADVQARRGAAVRHLGAVLEGGRNVYWSLSAWQNLRYFARLRGLRRREYESRAEWLLRELGLWDRRHQQVGGYSRGMQQKVAIATALVTDPALLLLDEPTIGLDVTAARTVKAWIRRLAAEDGRAVVLTTHQLAVAQELSDRVAVIRDGQIVADRPVADLLAQFQEDRHEIHVGSVPDDLAALLPSGVGVTTRDGHGATITVSSTDGQALYDVLLDLSMHQVPLLSVAPVQPTLEDVFLRLVGDEPR